MFYLAFRGSLAFGFGLVWHSVSQRFPWIYFHLAHASVINQSINESSNFHLDSKSVSILSVLCMKSFIVNALGLVPRCGGGLFGYVVCSSCSYTV